MCKRATEIILCDEAVFDSNVCIICCLLGSLVRCCFFFTWFRLLMHQNRVNVYKNLPFLSVGVQNELVKYGKESNNRDRLMTKLILWMILIWTIVIAHIRFNYDLVLQAVLLLLLFFFMHGECWCHPQYSFVRFSILMFFSPLFIFNDLIWVSDTLDMHRNSIFHTILPTVFSLPLYIHCIENDNINETVSLMKNDDGFYSLTLQLNLRFI